MRLAAILVVWVGTLFLLTLASASWLILFTGRSLAHAMFMAMMVWLIVIAVNGG